MVDPLVLFAVLPEAVLLVLLDSLHLRLQRLLQLVEATEVQGRVHLLELGQGVRVQRLITHLVETVAVAPTPFFQDGEVRETFGCTQASLYRMVLGFADDGTPEAVVNFARGTSEDPASPHFDDRDPAWAAIEYEPLLFRRADVEAKVTERQTLEAKK